MTAFLRAALAALGLLLCIKLVLAHGPDHPQVRQYSQTELEWIARQFSRDGMHCCTPDEMTFLDETTLSVTSGEYRVHIRGQWVVVPQQRLMQHVADDPSPFPGEVYVFYSMHNNGPLVWCLVIGSLF